MFMVPVPFKTTMGLGRVGVKHVRMVCHNVSGEGRASGGGGSAGGLCHCEEAFEWQQLASEESTNHKNDHILDKETNGETT